MQKILTLIIVLGVCLFICSCGAVGIEKPQYTVQEQQDDFELRRHESQVVAETLVEADFKEAGNVGFGRLFKYISGENKTQQDIPMTAPVSMQKTAGLYAVSFLLPSSYTLQTAPEPLDKRIVLKEIPAHTAAVVRYSGRWSQSRYEQKKYLLKTFIESKGLTPTGEPVFARYNSPFQLWFLRRNEVIILVNGEK